MHLKDVKRELESGFGVIPRFEAGSKAIPQYCGAPGIVYFPALETISDSLAAGVGKTIIAYTDGSRAC